MMLPTECMLSRMGNTLLAQAYDAASCSVYHESHALHQAPHSAGGELLHAIVRLSVVLQSSPGGAMPAAIQVEACEPGGQPPGSSGGVHHEGTWRFSSA